jgi:hypothetical protein
LQAFDPRSPLIMAMDDSDFSGQWCIFALKIGVRKAVISCIILSPTLMGAPVARKCRHITAPYKARKREGDPALIPLMQARGRLLWILMPLKRPTGCLTVHGCAHMVARSNQINDPGFGMSSCWFLWR